MPATGTVKFTNYKKITVAAALGETWEAYAYDFNGKTLPSVTIEVNSTVGVADIQLSDIIGTLGSTPYNLAGTKITIVALTGATNDVTVSTLGTDTIGSLNSVTLNTDGANVILTPVNGTDWSATVSL